MPSTSLWDIFGAPAWAQQINTALSTLTKKVDRIMAAVQVEQDDLDALATKLEAVKSALESEIQNLQQTQNLPAGSLDGLNQALSDLQSLETPAPSTE